MRSPAGGSSAPVRASSAVKPAVSSGEAAAMCLQGAAAIGDRCGDCHGLVSVFNLFGHGEALQLGIEI